MPTSDPRAPRASGNGATWVLMGVAGLGLLAWRENGDSWQRSLSKWWHEPGHSEAVTGWGIVAGLALILALMLGVLARRKRRDRAALAARIAEDVRAGIGLRNASVRVRSWKGLQPVRLLVSDASLAYTTGHVADELETAIKRATTTVLGGTWLTTRTRQSVVLDRGPDLATDATVDAPPELAADTPPERVERVLRDAMPGVESIRVTARDDETGAPSELEVGLTTGVALASPRRRDRIVETLGETLGGRWAASWELANDQVTFRLRPPTPELVGPFLDVPDPGRGPVLRYGIAEGDEIQEWELDGRSPHALVIGTTGGGKTTTLRALIVDATRQGVEVVAADPKGVEMLGMRWWPGVSWVATSAREMADMLLLLQREMQRRHEVLQRGEVIREELHPILVVLDEFQVLRMRIEQAWAIDRDASDPEQPPVLTHALPELAVMARSARIHLLVATQRPDAQFVGGAVGDQFQHRVSLSSLSPHAAVMLWADPRAGRSLPAVDGRAIATGPDGPREVQIALVPDPDPNRAGKRPAAERDVLELLRPTAPAPSSFGNHTPGRAITPTGRPGAADAALIDVPADTTAEPVEPVEWNAGEVSEWRDVIAEVLVAGDVVRLGPGDPPVEVVSVEPDPDNEDNVRVAHAEGVVSLPSDAAVSVAELDGEVDAA